MKTPSASRRIQRERSPMPPAKTALKTVSGSRFKRHNLDQLEELVAERVPPFSSVLTHGMRFFDSGDGDLTIQAATPYMADLIRPYLDAIQECASEAMGGRRIAAAIQISSDGFPRPLPGGLLQAHADRITERLTSLVPNEDDYEAWLKNCIFMPRAGVQVSVGAPTAFIVQTCQAKYASQLTEAVASVFGERVRLRFDNVFIAGIHDNVVKHDPAVRERIAKNGGYAGETNITKATDKAIREQDASNTDKAVETKVKSGFYGRIYFMIAAKYVEDTVAKLAGKPREVTALKVFMMILANLEMETYRANITATQLAATTKTALPNVSTALKLLEEVGAITLIRKGGKVSEIWINPNHAYRGHGHLQATAQSKFNQASAKIEKAFKPKPKDQLQLELEEDGDKETA